MNKKGFTLVEVILVLAIMSIILLILVPNVFVMINKNNEKSCNSLINNIESAAKIYVTNNKYNLGFSCPTEDLISTIEITLQTLVDSGDLTIEGDTIINPVTDNKVELTNKVEVSYNCNTKEFSYAVNGIVCTK